METLKSFKALTKAKACFSMILYFRGASLNALLKNAIGFSCPFKFFCNRTVATMCSDANEKMKKSFVKSGLMRTGVLVNACFTSSNDFFAYKVHLTPCSILSILVMFLRSSARLGMNLIKKLIFPMKD